MQIKEKVFLSFDYETDVLRVSQVRQMGAIADKPLLNSNKWEEVRKSAGGIKKWIDDNMKGRDCLVVLVGENTSEKEWVNYEIETAWNRGMGVVGIYIHNLKCPVNGYGYKGKNPFEDFKLDDSKDWLSDYVKCYNPSIQESKLYEGVTKSRACYKSIEDNIRAYIKEAIRIRKNF